MISTEALSALTVDERVEYFKLHEKLFSGETLREYILRVSPHHPPPRHFAPIIEQLELAMMRPGTVNVAFSMPPRHGKRIADSTPVLTPIGWRTHGELKPGDDVFAPDGTATRVTYVSPRGPTDLAVTFSDGEVIRCHDEHLWTVRVRGTGWQTLETKEMVKILTSGSCRNGKPRARLMVDFARPLERPHAWLPIDPYLLGLWLGDGSTGTSRLNALPADASFYMDEARRRGHEISGIQTHPSTGVLTFTVRGLGTPKIGKKHVPISYLLASEPQRRDLLRGLVDSDGSVGKDGRVRFVNTNERLARDVAQLVSSIGYRVSVDRRAGHSSTTLKIVATKDDWCVSWTPTDGAQQALLPRKDRRISALRRLRSVVSIERCDPEEGQCIQVEHESHQYLVGERLVPTHNTVLIQHAIAWWLSRRPADTCAYASYSEKQAHSKSRKTRDLALKGGVRLRHDSSNLGEWRTHHGGGLLSGGAGSGLTGQGVSGLMVVDDPFKSMKEAQSQARRDEVAEWFDAVVQTRNEGASTIVIHTRWNEDDLIGRLKKDDDFVIINIPAIAEENDPIGREVGEPLWPERGGRFSIEGLEKRRRKNLFVFLALYQGQPRPKGGKVFVGPAHYYDPTKLDIEGMTIVNAADPAATKSTSSDFCVAISAWVSGFKTDEMKVYIREVFREQMEVPEFASQLVAFQLRNGGAPINVEAVGAFKAVPQLMRIISPEIQLTEIQPQGDKFARAQPVAGAWKDARIFVPYDAPWLVAFLEELALFTGINDRHDDQVDTLSHLYNHADVGSIFDVVG